MDGSTELSLLLYQKIICFTELALLLFMFFNFACFIIKNGLRVNFFWIYTIFYCFLIIVNLILTLIYVIISENGGNQSLSADLNKLRQTSNLLLIYYATFNLFVNDTSSIIVIKSDYHIKNMLRISEQKAFNLLMVVIGLASMSVVGYLVYTDDYNPAGFKKTILISAGTLFLIDLCLIIYYSIKLNEISTVEIKFIIKKNILDLIFFSVVFVIFYLENLTNNMYIVLISLYFLSLFFTTNILLKAESTKRKIFISKTLRLLFLFAKNSNNTSDVDLYNNNSFTQFLEKEKERLQKEEKNLLCSWREEVNVTTKERSDESDIDENALEDRCKLHFHCMHVLLQGYFESANVEGKLFVNQPESINKSKDFDQDRASNVRISANRPSNITPIKGIDYGRDNNPEKVTRVSNLSRSPPQEKPKFYTVKDAQKEEVKHFSMNLKEILESSVNKKEVRNLVFFHKKYLESITPKKSASQDTSPNTFYSSVLFKDYYGSREKQFSSTSTDSAQRTSNIEGEFEIREIFPEHFNPNLKFFDISLPAIINSLKPHKNTNLFNQFDDKVFNDRSYNCFRTHDLLLRYELYDTNEIEMKDIENFARKYRDYISTRVNCLKITYLPLIIGIYKIKVLQHTKILVLQRHPFCFSQFHQTKYWYTLVVNTKRDKAYTLNSEKENNDKIIPSDDLAINELMSLSNEDYTEYYSCLKRDVKFMDELCFFSGYKLNIFVINDQYGFNSNVNVNETKVKPKKTTNENVLVNLKTKNTNCKENSDEEGEAQVEKGPFFEEILNENIPEEKSKTVDDISSLSNIATEVNYQKDEKYPNDLRDLKDPNDPKDPAQGADKTISSPDKYDKSGNLEEIVNRISDAFTIDDNIKRRKSLRSSRNMFSSLSRLEKLSFSEKLHNRYILKLYFTDLLRKQTVDNIARRYEYQSAILANIQKIIKLNNYLDISGTSNNDSS